MFINEMPSEAIVLKVLNKEVDLAVAKYPASGNFIDVSDMDKFAFYIAAGALTSAITAKVQQADAADGTPSDVTGATTTLAATDDNTERLIEVKCANLTDDEKPFVTLDIAGAAGDDDYATILFLGFPKKKPVTQPTTLTVVQLAG